MKKPLLLTLLSICFLSLSAQDIHFTFDNAEKTEDGGIEYYEVDVFIQTLNNTGSFKLGSGQLYFNYNTSAFGMNVVANNKIEITQPAAEGYIAGQIVDEGGPQIYGSFTLNDNTVSRVSWAFSQVFSSSTFADDNVDDTARLLCHIKIEYTDSNIMPEFMFEDGSGFDNQFFTACGPESGGNFTNADCTNHPGTQLFIDTFDSAGATLGVEEIDNLDAISLHPNPVDEVLIITINDASNYSIIDITGKLVQQGTLVVGANQLDLKSHQAGIYFLRLESSNRQVIRKIIKE